MEEIYSNIEKAELKDDTEGEQMLNKLKVRPQGWLKEFLLMQLNGLTGHIQEAGFPFDEDWWGTDKVLTNGENPGWWVYEQTAYWLDGYIRCGILLDDDNVINRAAGIIYGVLDKPDANGYLGPKFLKQTDGWSRWPHVVFFRACMALFEHNNDEKIITALSAHYLNGTISYDRFRDVLNVEIILWLYGKTGDSRLLKLAEESYLSYNKQCADDNCDRVALSGKKPYAHGVTYNEYSKLGAILYRYTEKEEYLNASVSAYEKIDKYFMLPGGCHSSAEFLLGNDSMDSYETCDITDYTWALNYLFEATQNAAYADKIEKCIFNAGIGAVLEDFKGLQYFSCANQVIADSRSNHNLFFKGDKWMSYRPNPGTECCPGNVNRFMPNYIFNMWKVKDSDIYAVMYGASVAEFDGIKITETTDYPFNENIAFDIKTTRKFTLHLRIPEWAIAFNAIIDGKTGKYEKKDGFIPIAINQDCRIKLAFTSEVAANKTKDGVYFSKGPFVYSLGQIGWREIDRDEPRSSKDFPAYNMYANEKWNYGIAENASTCFKNGDGTTFDLKHSLPSIEVDAHEAIGWDLIKEQDVIWCNDLYTKKILKKSGSYVFTPPLNYAKLFLDKPQKIVLHPYGACKLRITVFPVIG